MTTRPRIVIDANDIAMFPHVELATLQEHLERAASQLAEYYSSQPSHRRYDCDANHESCTTGAMTWKPGDPVARFG